MNNKRIKKPVPVKPRNSNFRSTTEDNFRVSLPVYDETFNSELLDANEYQSDGKSPKSSKDIAIFMCVQCKSVIGDSVFYVGINHELNMLILSG
ncbi:hypothetical protein AYI68_g5084 [Smittium mucronatum]|uniref:Mis18 domain-containing protein n=1 Tax=Smittium mucronatum TaxID=133383 RepID=A0A1R0GV94_9FUNG|nr:hypothetical protein AYI68_g5084 [Smittium mucronatum]